MRCLKCGRELKEQQVFCDECREDMANYPVKPGTPIQLPPRNDNLPRKKPLKKRKQLKPEELLPRLRANNRLLTIALIGLLVAFVLALLMLLYLLDQRDGINNIFWFLS